MGQMGFAAAGLLVLAVEAVGQDPPPEADPSFGCAVAHVGDLDGDGYADWAIGAVEHALPPYAPSERVRGGGYVVVVSGRRGEELFRVRGERSGDLLGWSVAAIGDLDGDGRSELAIGAPQGLRHVPGSPTTGYVLVVSGADGRVRTRYRPEPGLYHAGTALAALGDVDGDDVPDWIVGGSTAGERCAAVVSGKDASTLYEVEWAWPEGQTLPRAVCALPDVNGDGVPDWALGAPGGGLGPPGRITLRSGVDGALVSTIAGRYDGDGLGMSLARVADRDGDGIDDLVATLSPFLRQRGDALRPCLTVHAGGTGREIASGATITLFGTDFVTRVAAHGSFVVVAVHSNQRLGAVYRVDADMELARLRVAGVRRTLYGHAVEVVPDVSGDDVPDVLVGCPHAPGGGKVELVSGADGRLLRTHRP